MSIKVGDRLPSAKFRVMTGGGPGMEDHRRDFQGQEGRVVRGARRLHRRLQQEALPSVVQNADAIKAKGVDTIAVTGVNDISVMDAWKKASGADKVEFLADGNGEFAKAIDLTLDLAGAGMGTRSKRYSMLVDDGVVKKLNVEEPGQGRSVRRRRDAEAALKSRCHALMRHPEARAKRASKDSRWHILRGPASPGTSG